MITSENANLAPERGDALSLLSFPFHKMTEMIVATRIYSALPPCPAKDSDQSTVSCAHDVKPHQFT